MSILSAASNTLNILQIYIYILTSKSYLSCFQYRFDKILQILQGRNLYVSARQNKVFISIEIYGFDMFKYDIHVYNWKCVHIFNCSVQLLKTWQILQHNCVSFHQTHYDGLIILFRVQIILIDESLKCRCFDGRGDSVVTKLYN